MNIFLETKNLTIQIANKTICRHLNLQIQSGDIWGVLGANGSGKTTLLHTLATLHPTQSGDIFLQDKNIKLCSSKKIAQQLGILLQDTQPTFPRTVFEYCLEGRHPHLSYFSRENKQDVAIAKQALINMELDNLAEQNVQTLSGGERRRLAIATLLTQAPPLYLLDEPTNHLDLRHQIKVLNHFKNLAKHSSSAVVMSLHDINLARQYCNKILMLFGDEKYLYGETQQVMTVNYLTRLYGCSVKWAEGLGPVCF